MSNIITLKDEAKLEIYKYIDKEMRKLPKAENGEFDEFQEGYQDNDIDALRHAYVSGVYCMKYGKRTSDLLGRLNEYFNLNYSKISKKSQNMDLWNNAIGRKYGARANSKKEFIDQIKAEKYPKYSIRVVDGVEIPFSKRDRFKFNNLG